MSPEDSRKKNAQEIEFNVRIPLSVSILVLVASVFAISLYYYFTESPSDTLIFAAAVAAAAGALLAAIYTSKTLNFYLAQALENQGKLVEAASLDRKIRALEFAARWNDPSMRSAQQTCRELINLKNDSLEEMCRIIESGKLDDVIHLMNHLEELALIVKYGVVDEEVIRNTYEGIVTQVWGSMEKWVFKYRAEKNYWEMWRELEQLNSDWKSNRKD